MLGALAFAVFIALLIILLDRHSSLRDPQLNPLPDGQPHAPPNQRGQPVAVPQRPLSRLAPLPPTLAYGKT